MIGHLEVIVHESLEQREMVPASWANPGDGGGSPGDGSEGTGSEAQAVTAIGPFIPLFRNYLTPVKCLAWR